MKKSLGVVAVVVGITLGLSSFAMARVIFNIQVLVEDGRTIPVTGQVDVSETDGSLIDSREFNLYTGSGPARVEFPFIGGGTKTYHITADGMTSAYCHAEKDGFFVGDSTPTQTVNVYESLNMECW